MAVRWVLGRLGEMRPAQRRFVEAALARLGLADAGAARAAAGWTANVNDQLIAEQAAIDIGQRLRLPLTLKLVVGRGPIESNGADMATGPPFAPDDRNPVTRCVITIGPSGEAYLAKPAAYRTLITHEVFHCFQLQLGGYLAYTGKRIVNGAEVKVSDRNWMYEGSAHWAACEVAPDPDVSYIPDAVDAFIVTPETPLFERSYEAVALFRLLTARGIDLWSRWPSIVSASGDAATFAALGAETALDSWASFTFREPARGTAWDLNTRCVTSGGPRTPRSQIALTDGQSAAVKTAAFTTEAYKISSDADVVTFRLRGRARLAAEGIDETDLADRSYCTDPGGCRCPRSAGPVPEPPPLGGAPALLALTGATGGTSGEVLGRTIYDYCRVKPPQLIVPGRSVGKLYLGQSRRSALRAVPTLIPGGSSFTPADAMVFLLRGGGGAFPVVYEIGLGLCNPVIITTPAALAACRVQFPKSSPNILGLIQTGSPDFATRSGLGPGAPASAVIAEVGESNCERDVPGNENYSWDRCIVPEAGTRGTIYEFVGEKDAETVLAVAVYDSAILPTKKLGASPGT